MHVLLKLMIIYTLTHSHTHTEYYTRVHKRQPIKLEKNIKCKPRPPQTGHAVMFDKKPRQK